MAATSISNEMRRNTSLPENLNCQFSVCKSRKVFCHQVLNLSKATVLKRLKLGCLLNMNVSDEEK